MTLMVDYMDLLRPRRPTENSVPISMWRTRTCVHCGQGWHSHVRQLAGSKFGDPVPTHLRCSYSKGSHYFSWEGSPTVWSLVMGDPLE